MTLLFAALWGIRIMQRNIKQNLEIISDIYKLTQIAMLVIVVFYSTIGYKTINNIKCHPIISSLQLSFKIQEEEATISSPDALDTYMQTHTIPPTGNFDKIIELLNKAIALEPDNAFLHAQACLALQQTDDLSLAMDHINKAIQLAPENLYYKNERAFMHFHQKNFNQLKLDIETVLTADPRNAFAHYMKACLYLEERLFEESSAHVDSASMFCSNYYLSHQIDEFIDKNSGPNKYFNMIAPYDTDILATDIYYYHKKRKPEPGLTLDTSFGIPPKGNHTIQKIKRHITRNYKFFLGKEIDFVYMYENGQNILVVIKGDNCFISKSTLEYIFVEPQIFDNFKLIVENW